MPTAERRRWPVRLGLALATLVYLGYSSFGIAAPFWWGHHGYHGATYMLRARMSLRLHMLAPATWTGFDAPPHNALYFHHPIGYHHLLSLLVPIFGEHEWLARGLAVAGGLAALWALYALVRQAWSREIGLVAVIVYVTLPIVCSFSVLSDPMLLALACVAWSLKAVLDLCERPSRRALVHAALAYALGGLLMWEAFFVGPFVALFATVYAFSPRGRGLRLPGSGRLSRINALHLHTLATGAACVAVMLFHIWFTHHAGAWDEFIESYKIRHAAPSPQYVIERHTHWVDLLYGRVPVVAAAMWFALWLARLCAGRARLRDLAPLTFLYVNTLYIYMFAEGSSVHLYRVFFYSGFFALATADLMSDIASGARRLLGGGRALPSLVAAAVLGLYLYAETPHAYANLIESRELMGTHGHVGYSPEQHKLLFAAEVTRRTRPSDRVISHYGNLGSRKEMFYYLDRSLDEVSNLSQVQQHHETFGRSVLIFDERTLSPPERAIYEALIQHHPVFFFDRYTMVDLRSDTPKASSYGFAPGPMSPRYRWLVSHKYPPLHLTRSGYLPGLCTALSLGIPVAKDEAYPAEPKDPNLLPCYHDYLIARGDQTGAEAIRRKLVAGLEERPVALGGAQVIAVGTVGHRLRVVLRAGGPEEGELRYALRLPDGTVHRRPRSPSMRPPGRWRAGQIYVEELRLAGPGFPLEVTAELWKPATPPAAAVAPPTPPAPSTGAPGPAAVPPPAPVPPTEVVLHSAPLGRFASR